MNEPSPSEESLRHFLLGKVDDAERERIERLFLTDLDSKERLLAAEQSLIDDYLDESLASDERASFLSQYAASADQRRKLRIAKSIKEHAEAQNVATPRRGWSGLKAKHKLILRIAAVVIVAVILAVWLQSRRNQPYAVIEKELATLNDPSRAREAVPPMATLEVFPLTLRNVQLPAQFTLRSDVRVLELHLVLSPNERHTRYRADLRKGGDSEPLNFPELSVQADNPGIIRLKIPTSILSPGDYKINLSSIAADGSISSAEEYSFTIGG